MASALNGKYTNPSGFDVFVSQALVDELLGSIAKATGHENIDCLVGYM